MEGDSRRSQILDMLQKSDKPISGGKLAKELKVSRQIIVGDIALLRAGNKNILATNKGYIVSKDSDDSNPRICLKVCHRNEDIYDELCTVVDTGARVKDVTVEHPIYGQITVDLIINNRTDAKVFVEKVMENSIKPLNELTQGVHYHTIEADNEIILIRVQKELNEKGYLIK